jgi:hypothetical protein
MKKPINTLIGKISCNIKNEAINVITGANDTIKDIILTFALLSKAKIYKTFATYTEKNDITIRNGIYLLFFCISPYMLFLSYTIIYIMLVKKYTEACVKIIIYGGIFFERIYLNNTGEIPHKKAITNAKYV